MQNHEMEQRFGYQQHGLKYHDNTIKKHNGVLGVFNNIPDIINLHIVNNTF